MKHAGVKQADLVLESARSAPSPCASRDAGKGFDAGGAAARTAASASSRCGQRAEAVGGRLTLAAHPGGGTSVTAALPAGGDAMSDRRPRLIIADDHRMLVQGLQQMLGRRFEIVGVAYAGDELLELLRTTPADCLLLDLSLPGRSGLELLPEVRRIQPDLRVLVLTMYLDRILAEASLAAGAQGSFPRTRGWRRWRRR